MASQHIRAQRLAQATQRLEDGQRDLVEALSLQIEAPAPLKGEALRDAELVMIRRMESAAEVFEAAASALQNDEPAKSSKKKA